MLRSVATIALLFVAATCVSALPAATRSEGAGCAFHDGVFQHGRRDGHEVALTFDACPTRHVPGFGTAIFEILQQQAAPATFFVSGRWAERHPKELAQLAAFALGEVALHGYRHSHLTAAERGNIDSEISKGREAIRHLGIEPRPLFRPPYGDTPAGLGTACEQRGVTPVLWDVVSGDPAPEASAARLEQEVLQRARAGSIIVFHINGRGIATPQALPEVIRVLRQRDLQLVTVTDLLHHCEANMHPPEAP